MVKKIALGIVGFLLSTILLGFGVATLIFTVIPNLISGGGGSMIDYLLLFRLETYAIGAGVTALIVVLYFLFRRPTAKRAKKLMKGKAENFDSNLENSRFMTEKERDFNFTPYKFTKLNESKKDGVPVYAQYNKKRKELDVNLASPMHGLIIGATGSGKTTTFINPMIQILGNSSAGSSMICTDPKGELFQLHSKKLVERGYKVMVLDLRDPYSSFRWNPLGDIYDRYQLYLNTGNEIYKHFEPISESDLELVNKPEEYGEEWYEYDGKAYAIRKQLLSVIKIARQKIYDELYEDLNDLISVICPVE
ncbi:MAG: type IV secretory system conjugative DNA transfer family protein, partial [Lachnospiraceae bacterium]|nr:type IV secretory system conjugative DNA transfer family protein [Lachnospiraceae bacterium]